MDLKEHRAFQEIVVEAIKNLQTKNLNLENIIDYIDYKNKVRYSEDEIIEVLLIEIKNNSKK